MKEFGLQLWSIRDSFKTVEGTRGAFQTIASYGYTQAQTAGTYDYIAPEQFRSFADEAGIAIVGTHYDWNRICNDVSGTIRYHHVLGTNEIGIGGYGTPTLDSLKAFIEKFNEMAAIYAKEGFKLSYHNHSDEFSNAFKGYEGKTKYDYLIEGLDPATTCFNLDTAWVQLAGVDVRDLIERLTGRLNIIHLKDVEAAHTYTFGESVHRGPERIEIGRGNMNFKGIIPTAEKAGAKYFIVEDEVYSTGDPLASVKMSADYIKANLLEK